MSTCQVCQTENNSGDEYCARCGSRLPGAPEAADTAVVTSGGAESADALNQQAIRAVAREEIPDALELVNRALDADPAHVPSIRTRADILRRIGMTTQAAAEEAKIQALEVGERVYAGFWSRALAQLLDNVFVFLISFVPGLIVALIIYAIVVPDNPTNAEEDDAFTTAAYGWYAAAGIISFGYYWIGNSIGATWGKRIAKVRVVSVHDGKPIGLGRGFVRHLMAYVGAFALYLGWLWMLWDKDRQTWHDKVAGSIVIKAPPD